MPSVRSTFIALALVTLLTPVSALSAGLLPSAVEPAAADAVALENDVAVSGSFAGTGATFDYYLDVPAGQDHVWFRLRAEPTASDFDLFVRRDAPASRANHDWASRSGSADEVVHLATPAAGRYHVNIESFSGSGDFEFRATFGVVAAARSWHGGADTTMYWAYSDSRRAETIDSSRAGHMNTVYVDGKNGNGKVGWTTPHYPREFAFADGESPVERVVRDAAVGGEPLAVAVRFATFHDAHAALTLFPGARIAGTEWVDPACPEIVDHVTDQILDLLDRSDVDEVNLDFVRYPAASQVASTAALPCTGGTWASPAKAKTRVVADAVAEIRAAVKAKHPSVTISADLFGYSCTAPVTSVGHDVDLMARVVDVVMPMLYPTSFGGTAGADPYGTVKTATARCVAQTLSEEQVKPWIQGFDADGYDYNTPAQVNAQIDGVRDADGSGAAVWWFPSMGTSTTTWGQVASHMPADWTTRDERGPSWFAHGFEWAPRPFTVEDAGGAGSWEETRARADDGRHSIHAGDGGSYAPNSLDHLATVAVDLTEAQDATLRFRHWADGEEGCFLPILGACLLGSVAYDYGRVQVSADGGTSWSTLLDDVVRTNGWETRELDLSAYDGEADVRVRFTWVSDGSVQREGWFLDDVEVADATWFGS